MTVERTQTTEIGITLDEARARIGAGVVYQPYPGAPFEDGDITSVGEVYVFVRYVGDRHAQATPPEALSWSHRVEQS